MPQTYWIGIDLGGTKILSGLFDSNLQLVVRNKQPTNAEQGASAVMERIIASVDSLIAEARITPDQLGGMGLAIPGQIDRCGKIVKYAPNLNWRDFDIAAYIPATWTWPLVIDNDVRMGTYGEWVHGAARDARHVFGIFAGTGIGGGLILNGELFHGFNGNAGEIGHIVLHWRKGATLESIGGRRSMMKRAKEMLSDVPKRVRKRWKDIDLDTVKSSQLAELYSKDDPIALQLIDDTARALGAAIGSVINLISPEVVVVGGGVAGALGESFLERIWEITQRYTLPRATDNIRFLAAALGDDSGITGSAAYAKHRLTGKDAR